MDRLFDPAPYDNLPVEAMGERPAMTAQEWLTVADELQDTGNQPAIDEALRKFERAKQIEGTTEFIGGIALF